MKVFRQIFRALVPHWLSKGDGERVLFSLGATMDAYLERVRQASLASMPSYAPPDALAPMGRDRGIVRGWNEPSDVYAARLLLWLDSHKGRGNPWALMDQLRGYLGVDMMIRTVDTRGTWCTRAADGTRSYSLDQDNFYWDSSYENTDFTRFWVILYPPSSLWVQNPEWGDADLFGGEWGLAGDTSTWGSSATLDQVRSVRNIIAEWKPFGSRCVNIIVAFDPDSFDPASPGGAPMPNGSWGSPAKLVGGVWVPSRLSTAIYWDGTTT